MLHVCVTRKEPIVVFHRLRTVFFLSEKHKDNCICILGKDIVKAVINMLKDLQVSFCIEVDKGGYTRIFISDPDYYLDLGGEDEFILYKGHDTVEILDSIEYYK